MVDFINLNYKQFCWGTLKWGGQGYTFIHGVLHKYNDGLAVSKALCFLHNVECLDLMDWISSISADMIVCDKYQYNICFSALHWIYIST